MDYNKSIKAKVPDNIKSPSLPLVTGDVGQPIESNNTRQMANMCIQKQKEKWDSICKIQKTQFGDYTVQQVRPNYVSPIWITWVEYMKNEWQKWSNTIIASWTDLEKKNTGDVIIAHLNNRWDIFIARIWEEFRKKMWEELCDNQGHVFVEYMNISSNATNDEKSSNTEMFRNNSIIWVTQRNEKWNKREKDIASIQAELLKGTNRFNELQTDLHEKFVKLVNDIRNEFANFMNIQLSQLKKVNDQIDANYFENSGTQEKWIEFLDDISINISISYDDKYENFIAAERAKVLPEMAKKFNDDRKGKIEAIETQRQKWIKDAMNMPRPGLLENLKSALHNTWIQFFDETNDIWRKIVEETKKTPLRTSEMSMSQWKNYVEMEVSHRFDCLEKEYKKWLDGELAKSPFNSNNSIVREFMENRQGAFMAFRNWKGIKVAIECVADKRDIFFARMLTDQQKACDDFRYETNEFWKSVVNPPVSSSSSVPVVPPNSKKIVLSELSQTEWEEFMNNKMMETSTQREQHFRELYTKQLYKINRYELDSKMKHLEMHRHSIVVNPDNRYCDIKNRANIIRQMIKNHKEEWDTFTEFVKTKISDITHSSKGVHVSPSSSTAALRSNVNSSTFNPGAIPPMTSENKNKLLKIASDAYVKGTIQNVGLHEKQRRAEENAARKREETERKAVEKNRREEENDARKREEAERKAMEKNRREEEKQRRAEEKEAEKQRRAEENETEKQRRAEEKEEKRLTEAEKKQKDDEEKAIKRRTEAEQKLAFMKMTHKEKLEFERKKNEEFIQRVTLVNGLAINHKRNTSEIDIKANNAKAASTIGVINAGVEAAQEKSEIKTTGARNLSAIKVDEKKTLNRIEQEKKERERLVKMGIMAAEARRKAEIAKAKADEEYAKALRDAEIAKAKAEAAFMKANTVADTADSVAKAYDANLQEIIERTNSSNRAAIEEDFI